nr:zinc finger, CCHC-type [Tanacetum cinerariifolium]
NPNLKSSNFMNAFNHNTILWHARLGHVHFKRMQDMSKDGDLCDLHATPSLGNKKYFVTFIDDASRAVVKLPDPKLKTLDEKGIECIFVGYAENSKAFIFFVIEPTESISINSIIESRDAIFDEKRFSSLPRPSQRSLKDGIKDIRGSVVTKKDDLKTFDEAIKYNDVSFWKEAINDEMNSIMGDNIK